ncbi:Starch-binding associating with outer membrane [Halpernia humi]|uniref:Starch-binding associating with outer membrane n=1 Tax=Halpernia humi TaxID=493375 RepID=A0A1H5WP25_9FLAO|nr:RagB/SusD family nutrient uptake outer membrane protein [Halpernia humi]SEG01101.1 Starch-binding associating with outer membrane [Halpernia humi]
MKKIIILAFALGSLSSCKDFLRIEPVQQISIKTELSTKKGVLEALNGAYYNLRSTEFTMAAFTYGDLLSGNLNFSPNSGINPGVVSPPINVDLLYDFDDDKNSSELAYFYGDSYALINNLNLILENLDAVPDATTEEKNEIKAETLALRAYVHFQLYKIYAQNYTYTPDASHMGIAYVNKTLKVGIDYPARNTAKETFNFLEADVNEAIPLFQNSPAIPAGEAKNFMSKYATEVLAAKIALWKNDWQTAFNYSDDIIKNSGISLALSADYLSTFAVKESILELPTTADDSSYLDALYNFGNGTYSEFTLSPDVFNLFETDDTRKMLYEKQSLNTKVGSATVKLDYLFPTKYKTGTKGLIYRLSEVYFIRAEAALHLNKITEATQDVNKIRNRAGLADLNIPLTIDVLLNEKRKEFPMENKYFFDLMRNHKNVVRNSGCISTNCSPTYPNDKFVAPIPQSAVEINSNIIQNPGY